MQSFDNQFTIVLVQPDIPHDFPLGRLNATVPLGLLVLAGCLKEAGFNVHIIDDFLQRLGPQWIANYARELKAQFVGISVNLSSVDTASQICTELRKIDIPHVIGGPEVTINMEYVLKKTHAPFAIQGEGEETLVELLQAHCNGNGYASIPGLTFFDQKSKNYITNPKRPWINMDTIPFLPFNLTQLKRYDREQLQFERSPVAVLNTSRGCPYKCSFCSNKVVWSRKYRCMSAERITDHITHILGKTDFKAIYFREDHFTLNRKRVGRLCDLILQKGLKFEWGCESRVDRIDESLVRKMRDAGCSSIWFGVESGSDEILEKLQKGFTADQTIDAFKICKDLGLRVGASIMFGIPGESREQLGMTLSLIRKLMPDWIYFSPFFGVPGSPMYQTLLNNPKYIYDKWHTLILANSDFLTWPEKIKFKQRFELKYNLQPAVLGKHLQRMGLKNFIKKMLTSLRKRFQMVINLKTT
jgi:radical SAM superfamily enzyme YgiQ (UPF0313 family)